MIVKLDYSWSAQSFNYFIVSVLRQIASSTRQEILFESPLPIDSLNSKGTTIDLFDAYAPDGFEDIPGPVLFEFKYSLQGSKTVFSQSAWSRINAWINQLSVSVKLTLVVITNSKIPLYDNQLFLKNNHPNNVSIVVWDNKVVENWISSYPIDFSNALNLKIPAKATPLSKTITGKNFEDKSNNNILAIKSVIETGDNFAFVLGAGVSIDPGAKSWDSLLNFFKDELNKKGIIDDAEKLSNKIGGSTIITAQLCKELYPNDSDYFWAIHQGLYENKKTLNPNYSLYHVAKIADRCKNKPHFRILTYNYDEYLESYLKNLNIDYNILFDSKSEINGDLSIYHVHGYLPEVKYKSHIQDRYRKSIYLTEENYNELYNHPYSWQISSQLSFFRENTCLFVGCSLADPNIRRLLEMTKKENRTHYAILNNDNLTKNDLVKATNHFARIGIEVIWVSNYAEISEKLKMLY